MVSGLDWMSTTAGGDTPAGDFISDIQQSWFSVSLYEPVAGRPITEDTRVPLDETVRFDEDEFGAERTLAYLTTQIRIAGHGINLAADFHGAEGETSQHRFSGEESEDGSAVDLTFPDGSVITIRPPDPVEGEAHITEQSDRVQAEGKVGPARDDLSRWAEPIEQGEYGSVEALIGELQKVLDASDVDDDTRARVQGAIEVLRGTHRAAKVGETPRGEIVAVAKNVVRFVATQLPTGIVVWDKAIDVLGSWYPSIVELIRTLAT